MDMLWHLISRCIIIIIIKRWLQQWMWLYRQLSYLLCGY